MAEHHWFKFWPQDWQRDPALRSCGIAARGLWMDMLCIMHDGAPYGHLTIAGKAATAKQIGTITGIGEREATRLLAELEQSGVFSRNDDQVIFSRRMVRDKKARDVGRENGVTGGNPALKGTHKDTVNGSGGGGSTPPSYPEGRGEGVNPPHYPVGGGGAQTLEAEAEAEARKKEAPASLRSAHPQTHRGSRLSVDWQLDEVGRQFAEQLHLNTDDIADKFRDYWHAKAGSDAIKVDWRAAWRNWCRKEAQYQANRPQKRDKIQELMDEAAKPWPSTFPQVGNA